VRNACQTGSELKVIGHFRFWDGWMAASSSGKAPFEMVVSQTAATITGGGTDPTAAIFGGVAQYLPSVGELADALRSAFPALMEDYRIDVGSLPASETEN
jgi:hypothetical protein